MNQPPNFKRQTRSRRRRNLLPLSIAVVILCIVLLAGGFFLARKITESSSQSSSGITINQVQKTTDTASDGKITIQDFTDVVTIAKPSVVEIVTETISSGNSIFGQYVSQGAGSGVIMSEDGYIITNNHVIEDANTITVTTVDGTQYDAQLIGRDSQTDLAVIKVNASSLTPAQFGDSNSLEVGEPAIAIGNPLGSLGGTVTTGIISALNREITIDGKTMTLLQTDAAINPGNSGGGLFDKDGLLIGIVNAKQSASGIEGLGFAIPISDATVVLNDLIAHGQVTSRAALNVSLQDITQQTSAYYNLEPGCYVVQVVEGGAADQAGLQTGDKITAIDGTEVSTASEVKNVLSHHSAGETISIQVDRSGKTLNLQVTLGSSSS